MVKVYCSIDAIMSENKFLVDETILQYDTYHAEFN